MTCKLRFKLNHIPNGCQTYGVLLTHSLCALLQVQWEWIHWRSKPVMWKWRRKSKSGWSSRWSVVVLARSAMTRSKNLSLLLLNSFAIHLSCLVCDVVKQVTWSYIALLFGWMPLYRLIVFMNLLTHWYSNIHVMQLWVCIRPMRLRRYGVSCCQINVHTLWLVSVLNWSTTDYCIWHFGAGCQSCIVWWQISCSCFLIRSFKLVTEWTIMS